MFSDPSHILTYLGGADAEPVGHHIGTLEINIHRCKQRELKKARENKQILRALNAKERQNRKLAAINDLYERPEGGIPDVFTDWRDAKPRQTHTAEYARNFSLKLYCLYYFILFYFGFY